MSKTYAIADLHGRYDLLLAAIESIEQGNHSGGTVVFTGDYVDRGPQSRQVIERLMAGPSDPRWKWICLQGNHEEIMLTVRAEPELVGSWWLPNGGGATLMSYGQKVGELADVGVIPQEHIDWLKSLPLIYVDNHRIFVHAGVDETIPLDKQSAQTMQWMIYPDGYAIGHGNRHVVHGHHQSEDGPLLFSGRTDLDTFAWFTGRLVIGVFDDEKAGGPITTIEIKGSPIWEPS
ncbi:serine/threonine protein phosphatase [Phyllobacterium brassicacearum]|uniref:Serine/threonine protein phosphatase n=1 Tax=Phyllobacterium brassicacearum TaxID=314235 RepID=A0A2P7BPV3_9HYPH|nr:metallophosphoesterase family protein [Phyllobacterium brassicacearum]PSH68480.1 serine/threonine protein phosphatase [Phyllobacterium brassicacearum]